MYNIRKLVTVMFLISFYIENRRYPELKIDPPFILQSNDLIVE